MKRELSYGMLYFTPCGKYLDSAAMRVLMASAVSSALPLGASWTPMPVDGWPSRRAEVA